MAALIFDMDGTLWDSSEQVAASWTEVLSRHRDLLQESSRCAITREDVQGVMGMTMTKIAETLFPEVTKENQALLLQYCCDYENEYLLEHGGALYPQLEKTLQELRREGHTLYIVSNCQKGYIETFLEHYGFGQYFDDIECFGNNGLGKAENIRNLAARNHLEQYYYVGDIQADYDATVAAGGAFIHAAYGFGTIREEVPELTEIGRLPEMLRKLPDQA